MKSEPLGRNYCHLFYKDVPINAKKYLVLGITLTHDIFQVSLMKDFFHYKNTPFYKEIYK